MKNKSVLFMAMLAVSGLTMFASASDLGQSPVISDALSTSAAAGNAAGAAAADAAAAAAAAADAAAAKKGNNGSSLDGEKLNDFASKLQSISETVVKKADAAAVVVAPVSALYLTYRGLAAAQKAFNRVKEGKLPFAKTDKGYGFAWENGPEFRFGGYKIEASNSVLGALVHCGYAWSKHFRGTAVKSLPQVYEACARTLFSLAK